MAMRTYLALLVLGVSLLVIAPGTTAIAGSSTYYAGKNSQGQKLLFSLDQTASGPKFDPFFTTMTGHCPATGETFTAVFTFLGFQVPVKNGRFTLALNDLSDRFSWSGTVTSKKASGKQSYSLAAFDKGIGLQACTTGSLSWTAQALAPASTKVSTPRAAYTVSITKASDGSVHFSVTH